MTDYVEKTVKVKFEGTVDVKIPKGAPKEDVLATNFALSRIEAHEGGRYSVEDAAYEEYCSSLGLTEKECNKYEHFWDNAEITVIDGTWEALGE